MSARLLCAALVLGAVGYPGVGLALDPSRQITQYLHRSWDEDRGLPQNSVVSLAQTADGNMWVGTWEGLARFDGSRFTTYDQRNTPAFLLNGVLSLAVDRHDALFVGTEEGLLLRNAEGFQRVAHPLLDRARLTALLAARDGTLWIGTAKGLFSRRGDAIDAVPLPVIPSGAPYITSLAEDRQGVLWIATGRNLVRLKDGAVLPPLAPLDGRGVVVAPARDGGVWVVRNGDPTVVTHVQQDVLRQLPIRPEGVVRAVREDRGGTLWLATDQGLARWDGTQLARLSLSRSQQDEVLALFESADGALWAGTTAAGVHRFSDAPMRVFGQPEGLTSDQVFPILEDQSGALWLATHNGLNRIRDGKVETFGPQQGLKARFIRSLAEGPPGTLWLGASNGLFRYDGRTFREAGPELGLPAEPVFTLGTDSHGVLWVAYPSGLYGLGDGPLQRIAVTEGLPKTLVHKIYESTRNRLWVGTGVGLFRIEHGKAEKVWPEDGREEAVLDLHEGTGGELWFGTLRGLGLWRDDKAVVLTTEQGLHDEAVFRILQDEDGYLWMSCNRGIFRMRRADLLAVVEGRAATAPHQLFDRSDGMRAAECNGTAQPAGIRTRGGQLWFPTVRGAVTFDPTAPGLNRRAPEARIDAVRAGGRTLPSGAELTFAPETRQVDFQYGALAFEDAERLRFRYRLVGHDPDWVEAGNRREAHYAKLRPGSYRFEVQVASGKGPFAGRTAAVPLKFEGRWVESLWFFLLLAGFGLAAAGGAYLWRVGRLKAHERQLEARVAERTFELERANRDLDEHLRELRQTQSQLVEAGKLAAVGTLAAGVGHEINNPLAYIVSNLNFAQAELESLARSPDPAARQSAVTEVKQALEESLQGADKVRRIVQDLKTFSRREEEDLLGPVDLHAVLESATKLSAGELRHRARVTRKYGVIPRVEANTGRLGQVFLNLLVNAAHAIPEGSASANEICLITRQERDWVVVEVKDTGVGMTPAVLSRIFEPFFTTKAVGVGTGLGLSLCRTYLGAMGGTLEAESEPGRGSTFRLRLKVALEEPRAAPAPVRRAPAPAATSGRVLVIDDDPLVTNSLVRTLREQHQVDALASARKALEVLTAAELAYEVVLCDLMMPEMTGMELHHQLARTHPERAAQLVFITGGAFTEQSREFLEQVQNVWVEKPFDPETLRRLVDQRVAQSRESRRAA